MSSNFGEIVKKLIPVFGEQPAKGLPKPPPSARRLDLATFTRGENAKLSRQASSLGRYVFGSEISYNKPPPRLPGLGW
jgi:hypothetical protein